MQDTYLALIELHMYVLVALQVGPAIFKVFVCESFPHLRVSSYCTPCFHALEKVDLERRCRVNSSASWTGVRKSQYLYRMCPLFPKVANSRRADQDPCAPRAQRNL